MRSLRMVELEERHLPDLLRIEKASQSSPWSEASFRAELDNAHGTFLVASQGGTTLGYACAWLMIDEAHITTVAVDPERRREGIGRRLVVDLLGKMREGGAICATLEVRASNEPAIKLYEDLGFVDAGRRKRYYPDNKEDAVVMWLHELEDWNPSGR